MALLSGGVGGARMARGFDRLDEADLTVVVNVGDDAETHGLPISPDIDTVVYTLAGIEGGHGWGRREDTFAANEELGALGLDNTFRLGDRDLALKIARAAAYADGEMLSTFTDRVRRMHGIDSVVLPASDDTLRTEILTADGSWISFQEYFVHRGQVDEVVDLRYRGLETAKPAPNVVAAIERADILVIAPSNPPLSIWPILALEEIRDAVEHHPKRLAVSPLINGRPVKGPADRVMASLGLPEGTHGVLAAYKGLIDLLIIHEADPDRPKPHDGVELIGMETLIEDPEAARRLAARIVGL